MQAEVRALHGPRGRDKICMLEGKPEASVAGVVSWGRGQGQATQTRVTSFIPRAVEVTAGFEPGE